MKNLLIAAIVLGSTVAEAAPPKPWQLVTVQTPHITRKIIPTEGQCAQEANGFLGGAPRNIPCPSEETATAADWQTWQAANPGIASCSVVNGGMAWTPGQVMEPGEGKYAKCSQAQ